MMVAALRSRMCRRCSALNIRILLLLLAAALLTSFGADERRRGEDWTIKDREDFEALRRIDDLFADQLEGFISQQQKLLDNLRRMSEIHERKKTAESRDLDNPISAFLLLKRLTVDWTTVADDVTKMRNISHDFMKLLRWNLKQSPTTSDSLIDVAKAIFRLQDTYSLTTKRLVTGRLLKGRKQNGCSSLLLSANDCFQLGKIAYIKADFYHAILWLEEARKHLDDRSVNETIVVDYLSHSLYQQGDVKGALDLTDEWLKIDPGHDRALHNKNHYLKELAKRRTPTEKFVNKRKYDSFRSTKEFENYERLCRRSLDNPIIVSSHDADLSCRYVRHHPSLYLTPAKEELVRKDPPIFIFHDVVTGSQIETIERLAKFGTSKVVPYAGFDDDKFDARSSKTGWLSDAASDRVSKLSFKARVLSNLTLNSAEDFQVLKYGIGGHYVPHNDYLRPTAVKAHAGNRIATFLCYLSDVTAGGATVFPGVGVGVSPERGSCLLWYNLKSDGEGDVRTRHASCPVLIGHKWAVNKWFRERGQEFSRLCDVKTE